MTNSIVSLQGLTKPSKDVPFCGTEVTIYQMTGAQAKAFRKRMMEGRHELLLSQGEMKKMDDARPDGEPISPDELNKIGSTIEEFTDKGASMKLEVIQICVDGASEMTLETLEQYPVQEIENLYMECCRFSGVLPDPEGNDSPNSNS